MKGQCRRSALRHAKTLGRGDSASIWWIAHRRRLRRQFHRAYTATLDGLGVDGKGAHTHYEQLYISSIEPRARLLHRLYQTLR